MDHVQEINQAIGAHGLWKNRLNQAIETGRLEFPVATVRASDQCAFGKWLYGTTFTAQEKMSQQYVTVVQLHSQFHRVAAQVAELATAAKKGEAEKLLAPNGEFASISAKLTAAMIAWQKSFSTAPTR